MLERCVKYAHTIRKEITDEVFGGMIDFQNMTVFERNISRRIIPFYSWIKGATRIGAKSLHEHPLRVRANAAIGRLGADVQEEELGKLPSFLRGAAIAPGFLQGKGGPVVFNTGAMNPWLTPVDIGTLGVTMIPFVGSQQKPFGGENPISMMNPMLKAPAEAFTGTDVFFGTPIPRTGSTGEMMLQRAGSLPLTNLLWNPFYGNARNRRGELIGKGTVFRDQSPKGTTVHNPWSDITAYLGSPRVSELRMGPVAKRAYEEHRQLVNG